MVGITLKIQGVLIYDVNNPVDLIFTCRAWFPDCVWSTTKSKKFISLLEELNSTL